MAESLAMPLRHPAFAAALWLCCALTAPLAAEEPPGDPQRGAGLFRSKCFACHSLDADRVGPRLGGVVGRPAGTVPGFNYSPALADAAFVWDLPSLSLWLEGPRRFLPGTRMPVSVRSLAERRDLIAYLTAASPAAPSR